MQSEVDRGVHSATNGQNPCLAPAQSNTLDATIAEHSALRTEIMKYNDEFFRFELLSATAIVITYAFLFSKNENGGEISNFGALIGMVPIIISMLTIIRGKAYRMRTARLAVYIGILEIRLQLQNGWEHFVWRSRYGENIFSYDGMKIIEEEAKLRWLRRVFSKRSFSSIRKPSVQSPTESRKQTKSKPDTSTTTDFEKGPEENSGHPTIEELIQFYTQADISRVLARGFAGSWGNIRLTWWIVLLLSACVEIAIVSGNIANFSCQATLSDPFSWSRLLFCN